jgi:tRNA A37 methylthiotransferase MiaB
MTVLFETRSKGAPEFWEGYTDNYIKVKVKCDENLENKFFTLKLKEIDKDYVRADFC